MNVNTDPPKRRVTLKDIAAELGVATATVSNAYNRPDQLSPALRARILEVAQSMGYTGPDPLARSLRRGRSGSIGVVYPDRLTYAFTNPIAALFLRGIATSVDATGTGLLLVSRSPAGTQEVAAVNNAAVDGFVVHCFTDDDPLFQATLARQLPTVLVDRTSVGDLPSVTVDNVGGARAAAGHLIALGHRHLGIIAMSMLRDGLNGIAPAARQAATTHTSVKERLLGYRTALEEAGLDWHTHVSVYESSQNTPGAGRIGAATLLAAQPRPTAILTMSDELAFGVLDYAAEAGLAVPQDLSVVGFDDTPAAALCNPPLTTVHQLVVEKGLWAGRLLMSLLDGEQPASRVLPTELRVRASTASPRSTDADGSGESAG